MMVLNILVLFLLCPELFIMKVGLCAVMLGPYGDLSHSGLGKFLDSLLTLYDCSFLVLI